MYEFTVVVGQRDSSGVDHYYMDAAGPREAAYKVLVKRLEWAGASGSEVLAVYEGRVRNVLFSVPYTETLLEAELVQKEV
jgi:hypothetical protein